MQHAGALPLCAMQKLYFDTLTPTCIVSFAMADNVTRTQTEPEYVNDKNLEAQEQQQQLPNDDAASVHSESSSIQAGVQKAMILKKAWSRTSLAIAFARYVCFLWSFFGVIASNHRQSAPYYSRHHLLGLLWTRA